MLLPPNAVLVWKQYRNQSFFPLFDPAQPWFLNTKLTGVSKVTVTDPSHKPFSGWGSRQGVKVHASRSEVGVSGGRRHNVLVGSGRLCREPHEQRGAQRPRQPSHRAGDTTTATLTLGTEKHQVQPSSGPLGRSSVIARALREPRTPRAAWAATHPGRAPASLHTEHGTGWVTSDSSSRRASSSTTARLYLFSSSELMIMISPFSFDFVSCWKNHLWGTCLRCVIWQQLWDTTARGPIERRICSYVLLSLITVSLDQINLTTVVKIVQCVAPWKQINIYCPPFR